MKNRLAKEIANTIRALEEFAVEWEKQFPEDRNRTSRINFRAQARQLPEVLTPALQLVTLGGVNQASEPRRRWRLREVQAPVSKQ